MAHNKSSEYTSNTEFDLAKRVQITNEVPPISLWHVLPSGLRNEFWEYFIGTIDVDTDVPVISDEMRPIKVVNGKVAPEYGPPAPIEPNFENPESFHSMMIDGVIMPEFDYFLHELYRYLDTIYPDHPDYDKLLTPFELNEMFRAAAALIGYVPDYKFLETWSQSITGRTLTREQLKWKIRDIRSLAFRRKFFGSYMGYKLIFSSIYRHGSVYITGTYAPERYGTLDYTDSRTFRKFRLIDYFGTNDSVYKQSAGIEFKGIIDPANLYQVYEAPYSDVFDSGASSEIPNIALGTFLYDNPERTASYTSVQTTSAITSLDSNAHEVYYARLSAPQSPTSREYTVLRDNQSIHSIELVPNPRLSGGFSFPLRTALSVYPDIDNTVTSLLDIGFTDVIGIGDTLRDDYIKEIVTYRDAAVVTNLVKGEANITIDPERSPVIESFPDAQDPRYGIEVTVRIYEEQTDGQISSIIRKVFFQGALEFFIDTSGRPIRARFKLATIPNINPISGEANKPYMINVDDLPTLSIGNDVVFVHNMSEEPGVPSWEYMIGYSGWLDSISWGYAEAQETVSLNIEKTQSRFTPNTFLPWKERASITFYTDTAAQDEVRLHGTISESNPTRIDVATVESGKIAYLSAGDTLRGPGIQPGTVIASTTGDSFVISTPALRFGTAEFTVLLRSARTTQDVDLLQFKTDLYSKYPETSASIFSSLWPSRLWPNVSLGYQEGLKDASLFELPATIAEVTTDPSPIRLDKTLFVEMSIDRVLRHKNTTNFSMGGTNVSLTDIPWLEYVESFINTSKRATEDVRVGVQLTMSTDKSGLYSIQPEDDYSDPNIRSRFITIPYNYEVDPVPAYVQIGTGGHTAEREKLFVSVSDLLRPPLYGAVNYDANRDISEDPINIEVKRRGVYASVVNQTRGTGQVTDERVATNDALETPLFEVPVGEYEYIPNLADPNLPSNRYETVQTSFYSETFNDIPIETDLVVNSPYLMKGEQLPRTFTGPNGEEIKGYVFRGRWNPSPSAEDKNEPNWPRGTFEVQDYFLVSTTTYVGTYEFNQGDWILWDGSQWVRRQWLVLGEWPPTEADDQEFYMSPSKVQLQNALTALAPVTDSGDVGDPPTIREALDEYFIYYIASRDLDLLDKVGYVDDDGVDHPPEFKHVKKHDWIILTRETYVDDVVNNLQVHEIAGDDGYLLTSEPGEVPLAWTEYQPWLIAGGRTYEIIRQSFEKSILTNTSFATIATQRGELIDQTLQIEELPRRYIARGSCNFQLRIDPQFYATDINGARFSLTEDAIYWDRIANRFYTYNTDAEGTKTKHYIQFQEAKYFKNLLPIIGTVSAEDPTTVYAYGDLDFDAAALSLTDQVKSGMQVYVRNEWNAARENQYFSHYVDIVGAVDSTDTTIIRPVTNSPLIEQRREDFRIALQGIDIGDPIRTAIPTAIRSYEQRFENKYFKNLLLVAAKVDRQNPDLLMPLGESDEEIRAMTEAMKYINSGDFVDSLYVMNGTLYQFAQEIFADPDAVIRTISYGPGIWLSGGTNGQLATADLSPTDTWVTRQLPPEWNPQYPVMASFFSYYTNTWWIFGGNGNIANSLDDGQTWMSYTEPDYWEGVEIKAVAGSNPYGDSNGTNLILIGGSGGTLAYYDEDSGETTPLWTEVPLPESTTQLPADIQQAIDDSEEEPPADYSGDESITIEGWDGEDVNAIACDPANMLWIIGGNAGKLAKTQNLVGETDDDPTTDIPQSMFEMISLPDEWGDADIFAIAFNNDRWVIAGGDATGTGKMMYSDNTLDWTVCVEQEEEFVFNLVHDITWRGGEWIAVANGGEVYASQDGITWYEKRVPNVPVVPLYATAAGADTVAFGGDASSIFTISNTGEMSDSLSVVAVNQDGDTMNIELDADAIPVDDWNDGATEKTVLVSFYTVQSIDNELLGIPASRVASFENPATGQLYVPGVLSVDTYEIANRVYMPRLDDYLVTPLLADGDPNPDYIGANGYPLYEEDPEQYVLDDTNEPLTFVNEAQRTIYYCNENGYYVDDQFIALSPRDFTTTLENDEEGVRIEYSDPRREALMPQFTVYEDWLESGSDIEQGIDPVDYVDSVVQEIYNEQDEEPYLRVSVAIPELLDPFNAITFGVLPQEPTPVPLVGVPHYRTDGAGNNRGIVAATQDENVFYSIEPLENNTILLATKGSNQGIEASIDDEDSAIYSIEPVQYLPTTFATEEGSVIAVTRDGKTYYTVEDDTLTGLYFHPAGYGSWADRPSTNDKLPWENDPNAFYRVDTDGDGEEDEFIYLQNNRNDPIHLVNEMGELVLDSDGNPIEVPAVKYFSYQDLLNNAGNIIEKDPFTMASRTQITGVAQDNSYFTLSNPIPMEPGATERQVRLNVLTLASIVTTEDTKMDSSLVYPLTVQDLTRYEPDRVYSFDSAYPSLEARPDLYEVTDFVNANGIPVYACDENGNYIESLMDPTSVTSDLTRRVQPRQPRYYLCQDWFNDEYFVEGDEDNPYWQYVVFEDYLDVRSKEWKQRIQTYRKLKGDFGKEMILKPISNDTAYVTFYPGLEYTRDAASMIVRQTEYIQYRKGQLSSIIVANPKYDKNVNPNVDRDNAEYGINYQSIFHEAEDLEGNPVNMFDQNNVVQSTLKGKWMLNYTVNTTQNFADPQDIRSSIVAITELGMFNQSGRMIAYANFPPIIYDSARHHLSVNLFIKDGEFAPLSD